MKQIIAEILMPLALDKPYSYVVPAHISLAEGDVVLAPLGVRETFGVVWRLFEGDPAKLKPISKRVDAPNFSENLRKFLDWIAWYTLAPRGSCLALALRPPELDRVDNIRLGVRLAGPPPARMTAARQRVLEAAEGGMLHTKRALADMAAVSTSVIDGLIDEGTLETLAMAPPPIADEPKPDFAVPELSPEQKKAADYLRAEVTKAKASVTLLEGVTGSGKTEVYFEAVAEAIARGKQTLILLPEIALTAQFLDRFSRRFGVRPSTWHSGVGGRKRERLYAATASGEARVIAGARSALFLPFKELGLIVVDEEHEAAYKQEDGVHYHARDMAVVRGRIEQCPVILASATPSIETRVNAERGRYGRVHLPERFGGRILPKITPIDLRKNQPLAGRWLSEPLLNAIRETVAAGEQALLFLNRRGYAPLTLCRSCGHRYECPNCSTWLVEHKYRRALVCHHCGHVERRPDNCIECGTVDSLTSCGPGVERIAEEVAEIFPDVRRIVLSSDMPGGTERMRQELEAVAAGEFPIVIGTQLVAKGHNFPGMTLVGVIDADVGLTSGDPRASERTFQLLQQVTGRAGRGERAGRALVQTYQPEHPVISALISGDADRFYREESRVREYAVLPPFGRLAALIVTAREREAAEAHARLLARSSQPPAGVMVLGPAEAPLFQLRGRYRYRLLVKTERAVQIQAYLREWIERTEKPKGNVRVTIDIDPQSFF
ncbi:primosomal protein N' [Microvirga sp. W0021]|uniref:Replication restart protein PriA n=1 Tax=Hohaiivirga grylli TaxID=3133970 RepID=A0ABV0BLJ2_9HYPH